MRAFRGSTSPPPPRQVSGTFGGIEECDAGGEIPVARHRPAERLLPPAGPSSGAARSTGGVGEPPRRGLPPSPAACRLGPPGVRPGPERRLPQGAAGEPPRHHRRHGRMRAAAGTGAPRLGQGARQEAYSAFFGTDLDETLAPYAQYSWSWPASTRTHVSARRPSTHISGITR